MKHIYPKTIAAAAKWLDTVEPDWAFKINLNKLNMGSCYTCILGQIYWNQQPNGYSFAINTYFPNQTTRIATRIEDKIFGNNASNKKWQQEVLNRTNQSNFMWAVNQLNANPQFSVRRKAWKPNSRIDSKCIVNAHITIEDYLANDWELFKSKLYISDLKPGEVFIARDDTSKTKWTKLDNKGRLGFLAMDAITYQVIEINDNKEVTKCVI